LAGWQNKKEMGGECGMYGSGACRVLVGKLMERVHLELLGAEGSIILKWTKKIFWNVAYIGMVRIEFGWGNLRERDHLELLSTDGRTILK